jgi:hypothetical protein
MAYFERRNKSDYIRPSLYFSKDISDHSMIDSFILHQPCYYTNEPLLGRTYDLQTTFVVLAIIDPPNFPSRSAKFIQFYPLLTAPYQDFCGSKHDPRACSHLMARPCDDTTDKTHAQNSETTDRSIPCDIYVRTPRHECIAPP